MKQPPLLALMVSLTLIGCDTGKAPVQHWDLVQQGAYSVVLDEQAEHALVGSIHHGGSLWQMSPLERLFNWNHREGEQSNITASDFSPNGKYAATADNRTIVLWEAKTGDAVWFWNTPSDIEVLALTNNGDFALLGMEDYTAALFNIKDGGIIHRLQHEGVVQAVAIKDDASIGITGSDDSYVRVWDMTTGKLTQKIELDNQVKTVAISQQEDLAFGSAHRGRNIVFRLSNGEVIAELPTTSGHYSSADFSEDGQQLLIGSSAGHIYLWDINTQTQVGHWTASTKNPWVTKNVYIDDVKLVNNQVWAAGANGRIYQFER